jgi:hypothetical protein
MYDVYYIVLWILVDQVDNQVYQAYQDWKVTVVWMELQDWMEHQAFQVTKVSQAFQEDQDQMDYQVFR